MTTVRNESVFIFSDWGFDTALSLSFKKQNEKPTLKESIYKPRKKKKTYNFFKQPVDTNLPLLFNYTLMIAK